MPYEPTAPPADSTREQSQGYLDRELRRHAQVTNETERLVGALVEALRSAGVSTLYQWDDSTIMADPGAGLVRGNNVLLNQCTQFAVSAETVTQAFPPFGLLDAGDRTVIVNEAADVQELFSLDNSPANNVSWWLFDVTLVSGQANNPTAGSLISLIWFPVAEIGELYRV